MPTQTFLSEYDNLSRIGEFVLAEAENIPFNSKELYAIELSVTEACENVIEHAYQGEQNGRIIVAAQAEDATFRVTITDFGIPFDPETIPSPDIVSPLDIRTERGLGVFIMYRLMDEVHYDFSTPGTNILVMIKRKQAAQ